MRRIEASSRNKLHNFECPSCLDTLENAQQCARLRVGLTNELNWGFSESAAVDAESETGRGLRR